jgi:hypothetical protein
MFLIPILLAIPFLPMGSAKFLFFGCALLLLTVSSGAARLYVDAATYRGSGSRQLLISEEGLSKAHFFHYIGPDPLPLTT